MTDNVQPVEQWRYEVRGSRIIDTATDEQLDLIQAAERLNESFVRAGVWAAKAGLAQARIAVLEQALRETVAELEDCMAELEGKSYIKDYVKAGYVDAIEKGHAALGEGKENNHAE